MRISFGLSAASRLVGNRPMSKAEPRRERREKMDISVLPERHARAGRGLREADKKKPRRQLCLGGAHALAAFVKRPQADRSNRRWVCSTAGSRLASTEIKTAGWDVVGEYCSPRYPGDSEKLARG